MGGDFVKGGWSRWNVGDGLLDGVRKEVGGVGEGLGLGVGFKNGVDIGELGFVEEVVLVI